MGILPNWRWELYARELVEVQLAGFGKRDMPKARLKAYVAAGYAPNTDNARRDANRPAIKTRIAELFTEALEYRDVRAASVVTRIDRIARANVVDFYSVDENGVITLKPLTDLPRSLSEAIKSIHRNDDGTLEVELWDKNQANFTLLKHLGGMPDENRTGVTNVNNLNFFAGLSVDDQRALAEALEALPAGPATVDLQAAGKRSAG